MLQPGAATGELHCGCGGGVERKVAAMNMCPEYLLHAAQQRAEQAERERNEARAEAERLAAALEVVRRIFDRNFGHGPDCGYDENEDTGVCDCGVDAIENAIREGR